MERIKEKEDTAECKNKVKNKNRNNCKFSPTEKVKRNGEITIPAEVSSNNQNPVKEINQTTGLGHSLCNNQLNFTENHIKKHYN